jgi:hypothetical protein
MTQTLPKKTGPWNPGISSAIPARYLPLSTVYQSENVSTSMSDARELADFTGLPAHELVAFRPERLIVHEVLIRVMADLSVPDGNLYEDLGINFRRMAGIILSKYVSPKRVEICGVFSAACDRALKLFQAELHMLSSAGEPQAASQPKGWFARLMGRVDPAPAAPVSVSIDDQQARWRELSCNQGTLEAAAYASLLRTAGAIIGRRGRLMGDDELIARLALRDFGNGYGSQLIGEQVGPLVLKAARAEGFKVLPSQEKPVILNVKGASAAGKSTLRPLQKPLVEMLGLDWSDFALISPDIFRKYLLDYGSLDEATRYAGSLSGHEIEIVDLKLDAYMAAKAARGDMPHLLIDRFRFDSFSSPEDKDAGGRLLTRFGDIVYMYFMITPPADTVERAWSRGEQVGRYKAVDDLLFHNIEAFSGMPDLFFTWAMREGKQVHYEFLDNSVSKGERPKTVAFGVNGELSIMDIGQMLNVDRYKRVNVEAGSRDEVFLDGEAMLAARNVGFLQDCCRRLKAVKLADQNTGEVYAWIEQGSAVAVNRVVLKRALKDAGTRDALSAVLPALVEDDDSLEQRSEVLDVSDIHTLGAWGGRE